MAKHGPGDLGQRFDGQHDKATQLVHNSEGLRDTGNQLVQQQSGKMIDGMHEMLIRKAGEISDQADSYFAMSRGSEEVARLVVRPARRPRQD